MSLRIHLLGQFNLQAGSGRLIRMSGNQAEPVGGGGADGGRATNDHIANGAGDLYGRGVIIVDGLVEQFALVEHAHDAIVQPLNAVKCTHIFYQFLYPSLCLRYSIISSPMSFCSRMMSLTSSRAETQW